MNELIISSNSHSFHFHNFIIKENVPLAPLTWFKAGGNARFFCQPTSVEEWQRAIQFAHETNLESFILGHGANILVSDDGFDGLVIRPQTISFSIKELNNEYALVTADAGASFTDLINFCLNNQLVGLEEFSGIPGTVGGSVFINIHYFEFLLSQFLVSAHVVHKITGEILFIDNEWFNFGYNFSKLHDDFYYLIDATFKLKKANDREAAYHTGRSHEIIRHRLKRYPQSGTCGSFFRNFFEHEVTLESNGKKIIHVAYYLDKMGVKGELSVGDAQVSYQHANMLINRGNATASDIINLARALQQRVYQNFGILPQPECQLIGFKDFPLLT